MSSQQRKLLVLILCIGIFPGALNAEVEEPDLEALGKKHLVYVEPENVVILQGTQEYKLLHYLERRGKWGFMMGAEYSSYEPVKYVPNFANATYKQLYGVPQPMTEILMEVKRNFAAGSIGSEFSVGFFKNDNADPILVSSTLSITAFRLGFVYNLDALSAEPYIVPFVSAGVYSMLFKETLGGNAIGGNSQAAPYVNGGIAFQLDWIDHHAALISYKDSHLQSTFVFVEGRKYFASSNKKDHDFSNDFNYTGGLKVEF